MRCLPASVARFFCAPPPCSRSAPGRSSRRWGGDRARAPWAGFNLHVATGHGARGGCPDLLDDRRHNSVRHARSVRYGVRQPAGVAIGIAPWNAPLILGVRPVVMPLAFGNTVMLKAPEQTPLTQAVIVKTFVDARVSASVTNVISNAPEDAARSSRPDLSSRRVARQRPRDPKTIVSQVN
ncbi:aldehyde dehydrogenase family protein [Nocardia aobensis]|uniref:Aldehyde dehydrogenase family protein n=1 Tax=Nocardia aobensis TaxID=257277 RepID=A0ABW6PFH9_9NOCA